MKDKRLDVDKVLDKQSQLVPWMFATQRVRETLRDLDGIQHEDWEVRWQAGDEEDSRDKLWKYR